MRKPADYLLQKQQEQNCVCLGCLGEFSLILLTLYLY